MVRKENYKIAVGVGKSYAVMYPIRTVVNTGAGPNLSHERLVRPELRILVGSQSTPHITDASKTRMKRIGQIILSVPVGGL